MNSLKYACLMSALMVLAMALASAEGDTNSSNAKIVITNASMVAPSPEKENLDQEWVEITNLGDGDANLNGWILSDQQNHTYEFKDFVLQAGASVKVRTGSGENTDKDIYCNRNNPIWNNDGDVATLRDASGNIVSRYPQETGA